MGSPSTPKISVLMSVYNGSAYLKESVENVLKQTFGDFEFVIIDDCSTDSTWGLLTEYAAQDPRIRLHKNTRNMGLTRSLNKGLHLAQGEYIARQDADDISLSTRFAKQVTWLTERPDTILISSEIQRVRPDGTFGRVTERACPFDLLAWHLLFHNHLGGHSQVMFRRQPAIDLGGYNEEYLYSQDYELWCRLAKVGKIVVLPEVLLNQRFHPTSISARKCSQQRALVLKQVSHNIEQLIGKTFPLSEVELLHQFWSTDRDSKLHRFPETRLACCLSERLTLVYQAYVAQQTQYYANSVSQQALRAVIGQKFLDWANKLSLRKQFLEKIRLYWLALRWAPRQVIRKQCSY